MNKVWYIGGSDAGGLAEDCVNLYQGPKGVLLVFVVKRDVDDQVSEPPGLTQGDFENAEGTMVKSLTDFQKLVNEKFTTLNWKHKVGEWFSLGIIQANEDEDEEDEDENWEDEMEMDEEEERRREEGEA